MFEIFVLSFIATFLYTPIGYLIEKGSNIRSFSLQLIFGLIILSFFSLLINFFSPLNKTINTIILLLSLFIIGKYWRLYLSKKFLVFCIFSSIIIFLLISGSNVYRPDAGLYHLPYISILNQEKIIFGLSNIHFRFGHISILQYTSAIFNNQIFGVNGISFPIALISSSVIINFVSNLNYSVKKNKYNFHFFLTFSLLIFILYKSNRFSEYGNDAPAHLMMFLLIVEIFKNFNHLDSKKIGNYFLISIFIIMNKIILLISILYPIILLFKIKTNKYFNSKMFFIFFFIIIWSIKNLVVSGCFLYPLKSSCVGELYWTDENKAKLISVENEAWAKGWPDFRIKDPNYPQKEYSNNFFWFETWSKNHLMKIFKIIIPYLILLIIFLITIKDKVRKIKIDKEYYYFLFISLLGISMWFLKVPVFRYGYSYIIIFFGILFSIACTWFTNRKITANVTKIIVVLLLSVFVLKNLDRIIFNKEKYYNYPWPKIFSMNKDNRLTEKKFVMIGNKRVNYSIDGYCMYSPAPCGIKIKNIKHKTVKSYSIFYKFND